MTRSPPTTLLNQVFFKAASSFLSVQPTYLKPLLHFFAVDVAVLCVNENPSVTSDNLHVHLNLLSEWVKKWQTKINETKSAQVTLTTRHDICPPVTINNTPVPVSYTHLDVYKRQRKEFILVPMLLGLIIRLIFYLTF